MPQTMMDAMKKEVRYLKEAASLGYLTPNQIGAVILHLREIRKSVKKKIAKGWAPHPEVKNKKSLEDYKKELKMLSDAYNRGIEMVNLGLLSYKEHCNHCSVREKREGGLQGELLKSKWAKRVCNKTITYQASSAYDGNYHLEGDLKKAFPQGICDAESDQGFFYIHESFVPKVLKWLEGRIEKDSADVSDTDGLMIK